MTFSEVGDMNYDCNHCIQGTQYIKLLLALLGRDFPPMGEPVGEALGNDFATLNSIFSKFATQ